MSSLLFFFVFSRLRGIRIPRGTRALTREEKIRILPRFTNYLHNSYISARMWKIWGKKNDCLRSTVTTSGERTQKLPLWWRSAARIRLVLVIGVQFQLFQPIRGLYRFGLRYVIDWKFWDQLMTSSTPPVQLFCEFAYVSCECGICELTAYIPEMVGNFRTWMGISRNAQPFPRISPWMYIRSFFSELSRVGHKLFPKPAEV